MWSDILGWNIRKEKKACKRKYTLCATASVIFTNVVGHPLHKAPDDSSVIVNMHRRYFVGDVHTPSTKTYTRITRTFKRYARRVCLVQGPPLVPATRFTRRHQMSLFDREGAENGVCAWRLRSKDQRVHTHL